MAKPLNILIIEDNPGDREYIGEILKLNHGLSFTGVSTLSEGVEELNKNEYDVILLDLFLPDVHGEPLKAFFELKTHFEKLNLGVVAIVIISGLNDRDVSLWAIRSGAQDYFEKGGLDIHSQGLTMTIFRAYERALHMSSELNKAQHTPPVVQEQAEDPLDALNRIKRSLEEDAAGDE